MESILPKVAPKSVLVVGGGIAGLSVACGLSQHGWTVRVIEIGNGSVAGSGLGFWPYAFRALETLGLREQVGAIGFDNKIVNLCRADGSLIGVTENLRIEDTELPAEFIMARPVLAQVLTKVALSRGVRLDRELTFMRIDDRVDSVEVEFSDGTREEFDAVIGADGVNSEVRRRYIDPNIEGETANGGFFRTLLPATEIVEHGYAFLDDGDLVYIYPAGSGLIYAGIYVRSSRGYLDSSATRAEALRILGRFSASQTEYMRELLEKPPTPVTYREVQRYIVEQPHRGRIVLIGDAAHSMPPNLSGGGGMAVEDAAVLTEMLGTADDVTATLEAYADRRRARVERVVNDSWAVFRAGPGLDIWSGQSQVYLEAFDWLARVA